MKGKHNESLSLGLFNNGKDVKMEKESKGVSYTSFEVKKKDIPQKFEKWFHTCVTLIAYNL